MNKGKLFIHFVLTSVLLMALWFIMSGKTETKFLILGAASSVLAAAVCCRQLVMKGAKSDKSYYMLGANPVRLILYFFWLLYQILKAALDVARTVVTGKPVIDPSIAWFRADYDDPAARAVLANSITLTPGTITIDITEDGIFSVHALTRGARDGLLDGSMQAKVAWLYGEKIDFKVLEDNEVAIHDDIESRTVASTHRAKKKKADKKKEKERKEKA